MKHLPILLMLGASFIAGCTTTPPVAQSTVPPLAIEAASATRFVETRYDVRGYREASNPDLRHEPHAVYRRTRVPAAMKEDWDNMPRTTVAPSSIAPLPPSEELAAELRLQRQLSAEVRCLQTALSEAEQKMNAQYARLLKQNAEVVALREQLEAERNRLKVEGPASTEVGTAAPVTTSLGNSEVKW